MFPSICSSLSVFLSTHFSSPDFSCSLPTLSGNPEGHPTRSSLPCSWYHQEVYGHLGETRSPQNPHSGDTQTLAAVHIGSAGGLRTSLKSGPWLAGGCLGWVKARTCLGSDRDWLIPTKEGLRLPQFPLLGMCPAVGQVRACCDPAPLFSSSCGSSCLDFCHCPLASASPSEEQFFTGSRGRGVRVNSFFLPSLALLEGAWHLCAPVPSFVIRLAPIPF